MENEMNCPQCSSPHVYQDGPLWICPECAHEWSEFLGNDSAVDQTSEQIKDAHGTILQDGDSVTVIKDLKVKGTSSTIKVGTKVKNIRLVESSDGHNIACKIDGFGSMNLKSEFVKKI